MQKILVGLAAMSENKNEKKQDRTWLLLLLLIPIAFAPLLVTYLFKDDFTWCGPLGDTIGGITGPLVSALSAVLVYFAFKAQIEANKLVQEQLLSDKVDAIITRVESYNAEFENITHSFRKPISNNEMSKTLLNDLARDVKNTTDSDIKQEQLREIEVLIASSIYTLNDVKKFSREFRYVLGVLELSVSQILDAGGYGAQRFLLAYNIFYEEEIFFCVEILRVFPSGDESINEFIGPILDDAAKLQLLVESLKTSIKEAR